MPGTVLNASPVPPTYSPLSTMTSNILHVKDLKLCIPTPPAIPAMYVSHLAGERISRQGLADKPQKCINSSELPLPLQKLNPAAEQARKQQLSCPCRHMESRGKWTHGPGQTLGGGKNAPKPETVC